MESFAYECYADHDVYVFLRKTCGFPLLPKHEYGQGRVIERVVIRRQARIGMVDEDPGRSHHGALDDLDTVSSSNYLEVRAKQGAHVLIVKPELEECFLACMRRVGLASGLGDRASSIRTALSLPRSHSHATFRKELEELYAVSKQRSVETLPVLLHNAVAAILGT